VALELGEELKLCLRVVPPVLLLLPIFSSRSRSCRLCGRIVPLKNNDAAALVTSSQVLTGLIELNATHDIRFWNLFLWSFVATEDL